MVATMTESPQHDMPVGAAAPGRLRVTRHGYDPADVHALLSAARARLVTLAERIRRAEDANADLEQQARHWRRRAKAAEAECRRLQDALAAAEATVATSIAEVQVRADHLVERARCEAQHLTLRAEEKARRIREEIELERLAHEAESRAVVEALEAEDGAESEAFSRFMSDEIADEPSREWVIATS